MDKQKDIEELRQEFLNSKDVLVALGDENRQYMILGMLKKVLLKE
jgi:hypothetical protein